MKHPVPPAVCIVGVRLTEEERAALDREVSRLRVTNPAAGRASRSSVIRGLLARLNRGPARARERGSAEPSEVAAG